MLGNFWSGKRVIVTGASGFVGSHLSRKLVSLGADIGIYIHKKPSNISNKKIIGDLVNDTQKLPVFLEEFSPEIVFHLAAQPIVAPRDADEMETMQTNITGTLNLLHACRSVSSIKSFVHISTDKVFGNTNPIKSDSKLNGLGHPYNTSKMIGDQLAQMYSNYYEIPMVVIRNANVYGVGDIHFERIIPRTIQKILRKENPIIRGDGHNTRDYLYVDDVIDGYLKSAELPYVNKLTTVNLGGFNHSVIEVVDSISEKMGRVDLFPLFEDQWGGEIPSQHIENYSIPIDWSPLINLDNGLDKTIEWHKGL